MAGWWCEEAVALLRRPAVAEMAVDVLLCAVPIWAAVMIGLAVGWSWRPRWTGLLFLGLRSRLRVLWLWVPPGLGARRLWLACTALSACSVAPTLLSSAFRRRRGKHQDKASAAAPDDGGCADGRTIFEGEHDTVTEKDLEHLLQLLDSKESGDTAWQNLMERTTSNMTYKAWRREPEEGPIMYCSRTIFEDATPELVRDFFWDGDFRLKWDPMLAYSKTLDEFPQNGATIVHWIKKFPFFCSDDREYIFGGRIWESGKTYYCVTKYDEILGKGSSKTVYRAFDEHRGMEVAWNQVHLHDFLRSPGELERLYGEIHLLKSLRHRAVMRLHASWVDAEPSAPRRRGRAAVNFVTELFTSGTLRQYRRKHPRASAAAVRRWCRQILEGLAYLHARGIIHRDLKCDNIFVNGSQGQVKIGDLGLAAVVRRRRGDAARCVVGTPEFMAPEVYAEDYDERADVYSFGMCVLEMVTLEYPYSECVHPVHIYKKVTSGIKPAALYKVKDPAVRRFIDKCLAPASWRPSAAELLGDPFLQLEDDGLWYGDDDADYSAMYNYLHQPACLDHHHHSNGSTASNGVVSNGGGGGGGGDKWDSEEEDDDDDDGSMFQGIDQLFNEHEDDDELHVAGVDITIKGKRMEDGSIFLRLRIADKDGTGRVRNIYFPFDEDADTALSVATEMVAELDITDHEVTHIAEMIDGAVAALLPHWRPGPGMDDDDDDDHDGGDGAADRCKNCRSSAYSAGSLDDYMSAAAAARRGCRCAEMHGRFEEITFQADEEQVRFQGSGCSSDDGGGQAEHCAAGDGDSKLQDIVNGVAQDTTTDAERSDQT